MQKISLIAAALVLNCYGDFYKTPSFQGFTGLINTPTAQVLDEGEVLMHFNNQFDYHLTKYDYTKKNSFQENYIFSSALFKYFEIQGRLVENRSTSTRDLSANIKLQIPHQIPYLPTIALGLQDIGGEANKYDNTYVVLDQQFKNFRFSAGYGKYDHAKNPNNRVFGERMDGYFGGVELKTFDWLYLLAENDAKENHAAVRIHMPKSWSKDIRFSTMIAANLSNKNEISYGFNLSVPLYEAKENIPSSYSEDAKPDHLATIKSAEQKPETEQTKIAQKQVALSAKELTIGEIAKALKEQGLENITIATNGNTLYVAYENNVFLHNEVDAMGVVFSAINKAPKTFTNFVLEIKKSNTMVLKLQGSLEKSRIYFEDQSYLNRLAFANSLSDVSTQDFSGFSNVISHSNSSRFTPRLELSPVVSTFVGTEIGVFDYMVWLRANLYTNIYNGIDISAVSDIALSYSKNYDPKTGPFRYMYSPTHLESLMLHNTDNIYGSLNTMSVGIYKENFQGVMDQWILSSGNETLKLKAGYFEQFQQGNPYYEYLFGTIKKRDIYLAEYSHMFDSLDFSMRVRGGKYWNQDKGFDVNFKRYFGDVAVNLYFQMVEGKNIQTSEQNDKYAGIGIEIPLTPRKTPAFEYGQVKGTGDFVYALRTTIMRDANVGNTIVIGGGVNPTMPFESESYLLNKNRLQLGYIKAHVERMVAAAKEYDK